MALKEGLVQSLLILGEVADLKVKEVLRLPRWCSGKETACLCRCDSAICCLPMQIGDAVQSLGQEEPLEWEMASHSWESQEQRSLKGYSPWDPNSQTQTSTRTLSTF